MIAENLSTLKINKLTKAQYEAALAAGTVNENELYMTEETNIDLTTYDEHLSNADIHVTADEKTAWDAKSNFSGNYNDLTNQPTIPTVPSNISAFNNDAGYLTEHQDISGLASKPTVTTTTLLASNWDSNAKTYSFEATYPSKNYDIDVEINGDICTDEQLEAWIAAKPLSGLKNKINAKGEMPSIDIPIILTVTYNPKLLPPYLSFIGNEDFTLKTNNTTKNWDGTLEYSTDTTTWNTWNGTEISSADSKLYLRGTGNTKITGASTDYNFVFTGTDSLKIACEGNIENLTDYETVSAGGHPDTTRFCYQYMFKDCTSLTTAPELPATTLAIRCYAGMFKGCTSLTTAPELPATTLTNSCYDVMFYGCSSLTTAPELPATTLDNYCYAGMFYNCTSLTIAPSLPATTLADYCYQNMFRGCSNIKLSTIQTGDYTTAYRIPTSGTGTTATDALAYMFTSTGGTFTGTPEINTTYYTSNIVV